MTAEGLPLHTALVTGATGFVGSALVPALLRDGVEVVACSRTRPDPRVGVRWVELDLPRPPPPEAVDGVEVVFHLAARAHAVAASRADVPLYERVNVEGTVAVARAAAAAGARRFVLVSSVKAMEAPHGADPLPEDATGLPVDPYGLSKRRAEDAARDAASGTQMDVVVLRPALLYGPGVKGNLAALLASLLKGRRPPVPDVPNRRSLLGVVDLVALAKACAVFPGGSGRTYVVTDGQAYSTRRIIESLAAGAGIDPRPPFRIPLPVLSGAARAGDVLSRLAGRRFPFDSTLLDRLVGSAEYASQRVGDELGFRPTVTIEDEAPAMASAQREQMRER